MRILRIHGRMSIGCSKSRARLVRRNRGDLGILVIAMCAFGVVAVALIAVAAQESLQEATQPFDAAQQASALSEQSRLDMTNAYDRNATTLLTTSGTTTASDGTTVTIDPNTGALVVTKGSSYRAVPVIPDP